MHLPQARQYMKLLPHFPERFFSRACLLAIAPLLAEYLIVLGEILWPPKKPETFGRSDLPTPVTLNSMGPCTFLRLLP